MKNNRLEHIALYIIVAIVILTIAASARLFAVAKGFDNFSLFIIFIIAIAIQAVIYMSIHSFLERLMLPVIGKLLAKIPFIRRKFDKKEKDDVYVEYEEVLQNPVPIALIGESERIGAEEEEEADDEQAESTTPQTPSLEEIRQEQLRKRAKEQEVKLNIALDYTRKTFVVYTSDENLELLIQNVQIYINQLDTKELKPIKVKELTINDLRHFGWNIWNFSKPRNQMDIACFLKVVFPDVFRDAEVESIKRHLKDDELKGVIKIQERLNI